VRAPWLPLPDAQREDLLNALEKAGFAARNVGAQQ